MSTTVWKDVVEIHGDVRWTSGPNVFDKAPYSTIKKYKPIALSPVSRRTSPKATVAKKSQQDGRGQLCQALHNKMGVASRLCNPKKTVTCNFASTIKI